MTARVAFRAAAAAAVLMSAASVAPARADAVADFYRNKTVTILSGFGAGGMYGLYSRIIVQHMPRHIPGNPKMIVQFMPGAGGVKAANYFVGAAPQDGTVLGLLSQSIALTQVLRAGTQVRYDAAKMHWLGSFDTVTNVLSVWNANSKVRTLADAKTQDLIVGAPGKGSIGYMNMEAVKHLLGAKFKIISGYARVEDLDLAFESGEVQGRAATFISIETRKKHWISEKKITHLVQFALRRDKGYPNVPLAQDLTDAPEEKAIFRFLAAPSSIGRGFSMPPGTPPDRVAAMRTAFEKTVSDPEFLKEARSKQLAIDWVSARDIEEAVKETVNVPKSLVDRVEKLFAAE